MKHTVLTTRIYYCAELNKIVMLVPWKFGYDHVHSVTKTYFFLSQLPSKWANPDTNWEYVGDL